MPAVLYAIQLLEALPSLIAAGQNVVGLLQESATKLKAMQAEGRDPTQAEWDELNAKIDDLRKQLHA